MKNAVASLALLLVSPAAFAGITSVAGNAVHDTTTDLSTIDFDTDVYESPDVVGFDEAQDVWVDADTVCVDELVDASDVGDSFIGAPDNGASTCVFLEPGWYSSQLLHYDWDGTPVSRAVFRFDGDVVGFAYAYAGLWSTDAAFGTAASYPDPYTRWVDFNDRFALSASNAVTITFWWHQPPYYDELRVITRSTNFPDADRDGVADNLDSCVDTELDAPALSTGCSWDQACPSTATWRYHTAYVGCVIDATGELFDAGAITERERNALVGAAVRSDVGR